MIRMLMWSIPLVSLPCWETDYERHLQIIISQTARQSKQIPWGLGTQVAFTAKFHTQVNRPPILKFKTPVSIRFVFALQGGSSSMVEIHSADEVLAVFSSQTVKYFSTAYMCPYEDLTWPLFCMIFSQSRLFGKFGPPLIKNIRQNKKKKTPEVRSRDGDVEHMQEFRVYLSRTAWVFGCLCGTHNSRRWLVVA